MKNELSLRNTNLTYKKDKLNIKKRHSSTFLWPHVGLNGGSTSRPYQRGVEPVWQVQPPVEKNDYR